MLKLLALIFISGALPGLVHGYLYGSSWFPMRYQSSPPCAYYPGPAYAAHQWASFCADMRQYQRAGYLISRLNLTQEDMNNFTQLAESWDIEGFRSTIYEIVNDRLNQTERNESLQMLDDLGPPMSFTDALEVFTIEQKGQVLLLFKNRRYPDVAVVTNGLIASLPDEDQPKARRFIQAVHYLMQYPLTFY